MSTPRAAISSDVESSGMWVTNTIVFFDTCGLVWSLYYVSFVRLGVGSGRRIRCVVDRFALFRGCLDGCGWCLAGSRGVCNFALRIKTGKMVGKVIQHTSSSTPSTLYTACCCITSSSAICRVDILDSGDGLVQKSHPCRMCPITVVIFIWSYWRACYQRLAYLYCRARR